MKKKEYDSMDEMYFHWYLMTLKEHNFILDYELQPEPFVLSDNLSLQYIKKMKKVNDKVLDYTVLNGHIYTPDAKITWNPRVAKGILYNNLPMFSSFKQLLEYEKPMERIDNVPFLAVSDVSYVEIKPTHDFQNMTRLVKLNQKWVWDKHNEFVNIITPQKLFNESFTPGRYFFTDKSTQQRKINYKNIKTIDEFIRTNIK